MRGCAQVRCVDEKRSSHEGLNLATRFFRNWGALLTRVGALLSVDHWRFMLLFEEIDDSDQVVEVGKSGVHCAHLLACAAHTLAFLTSAKQIHSSMGCHWCGQEELAFDKRLLQSISAVSQLFLASLMVAHGPLDVLGGSWECKSVSRAGRQIGAMDPRFQYFYNLVCIINFFQREQQSPMVYILENTYLREHRIATVGKADELVEAYLGAPIIIDAANVGALGHQVRLIWTNMLRAST